MHARRLLAVISASLCLVEKASGSNGDPSPATTKYNLTLGSDGQCITEINGARKKAGLNDFVIPGNTEKTKRLPDGGDADSANYDRWGWKPVCDILITEKTEEAEPVTDMETLEDGTLAFHVVGNPSATNCTAVVDDWQAAYSNFNGLPPANKQGEKLYTKQANVSFVALYNPSVDANADCRVVTCTKTITTSSPPQTLKEGESGQTGGTETKAGSALICLTTPDVLSKDTSIAPFTEEQWEKIVASVKGSASAVLPSLLSLAVAVACFVTAM